MAKSVSAKFVRDYLNERPALWAGNAVIAKNLAGRGKLNPETLRVFNKAVKGKYKYETGYSDLRHVTLTGPKGRKITVPTAELRKFAGNEGDRGRFSDEVKAAAFESFASA